MKIEENGGGDKAKACYNILFLIFPIKINFVLFFGDIHKMNTVHCLEATLIWLFKMALLPESNH